MATTHYLLLISKCSRNSNDFISGPLVQILAISSFQEPSMGLGNKLVDIILRVGLGESMLRSNKLLDGEDTVQVLNSRLPPPWVNNLVIRVNGLKGDFIIVICILTVGKYYRNLVVGVVIERLVVVGRSGTNVTL